MHEVSLCMELVSSLEDEARSRGFARVRAVWIEVGQRRAVEPEAMRFAFDVVTRGTLVEGARLHLEETVARGWCFGCDQEVILDAAVVLCPRCGSPRTRVVSGEELRIRQIEVE